MELNDATVIYYSSNREDPEFEAKIIMCLVQNCGGLPIVSVTQKPTILGRNIVVGDVGVSGFNMLRQIQVGCEVARTRFVISAEADCLYPPDYFRFRPGRDDVCYRNENTYLMGNKRDYFWRKREGGTWAQVVNRVFYLKRLDELFQRESQWDSKKKNFPKEKKMNLFDHFKSFITEFPCISIKTGNGMRHYSHSERIPIFDLPYWGNGRELKERYS